MERRMGSMVRSTATDQAVDRICKQWAAVGLLLFGKAQGRDPQTFGQRLAELVKGAEDSGVSQELQHLLGSYDEMSQSDLENYVDTMETLIKSLLSHKTVQTIVETCVISGYKALELFCLDKDPTKAWFKVRTVTDPEITIPDEFFAHLERQLQFVYQMMSTLEKIECSNFSTHVFRILMDYVLQEPQKSMKRYEGKILSLLSQVPRFSTGILNKVDIFMDGLKQNTEYRRLLVCVCKRIGKMMLSPQPEIVEGMEKRLKATMKMKPGPVQDELLPFLVETCQAMKVPPVVRDAQGDYLPKSCADLFKFVTTKHKDKVLDKRAMKLAIFSVGLASDKHFPGYWDKMAGYFVKFAQAQRPAVVMKFARLLGDLYCPGKFSVEDYSRFSYELMFEKSRIPVIRPEYQDFIDEICSFWVDIAKKDAGPVVDNLKGIAQVIPSLRDYPMSIRFLISTTAQLKATMTDERIEQVVVSLEPHLETLLNVSSPIPVITDTLGMLPIIWKSVPRSHMTLPSILQALSGHAEFSVVETCSRNYLDMMKTCPHNELPLNIGFAIMFNLLIKIHNKTPYLILDKLLGIVDKFLAEIISVIKKTEGGGYADDWKALVSTVERTVFPFLCSDMPIIKVKIHRIMNTIRTYADFPCLVQLTKEYHVEEVQDLKVAFAKEPAVFSGMFEYVAKFWNEMDKKQNPEFVRSLLVPLMFIARPGKGRSDPCSGFFRCVVNCMLEMSQQDITAAIHQLDPSSWPTFLREYQVAFKKKSGEPATGFNMILFAFMTHGSLKEAQDSMDLFAEFIDPFATLLGSEGKKEASLSNQILANVCNLYLQADTNRVQAFLEKVGSAEKMATNVASHIVDDIELTQVDHVLSLLSLLDTVLLNVPMTQELMTLALQNVVRILEKPFPKEVQDKIADLVSTLFKADTGERLPALESVFETQKGTCASLVILRMLQKKFHFARPEILLILKRARALCNDPATNYLYAHVTLLAAIELAGNKTLPRNLANPVVRFDPLIETVLTDFLKSTLSKDEFQEYEKIIIKPERPDEELLSDAVVARLKQINIDGIGELLATTKTVFDSVYWDLAPKMFAVWNSVLANFDKEMKAVLEKIWNYEESPYLIALLAHRIFEANPQEATAFFIEKLEIPEKVSDYGNTLRQDTASYSKLCAALAMIFSLSDIESSLTQFRPNGGFIFLMATYIYGKESYDINKYPRLFDAVVRALAKYGNTNDYDFNGTSLTSEMIVNAFNLVLMDSTKSSDSIMKATTHLKLKEDPVHVEFLIQILVKMDIKRVLSLLKNTIQRAANGDFEIMAALFPSLSSRIGEMGESSAIVKLLMLTVSLMASKSVSVNKSIATNLPQLSKLISQRKMDTQVATEFQAALSSVGGAQTIVKAVVCACESSTSASDGLFADICTYLNVISTYTKPNDQRTLRVISKTFEMFTRLFDSHRLDHTTTETPEEAARLLLDDASEPDKRVLACSMFELAARSAVRDIMFKRIMWRVISELLIPEIKTLPFMPQFLCAASLNDPSISKRCRVFLTEYVATLTMLPETEWYCSAFGPTEPATDPYTGTELRFASQRLFPRDCITASPPDLAQQSG